MLIEECVVGMDVVINNPNEGYYSHEYNGCIVKIERVERRTVDLLVEEIKREGYAKILYGVSPSFINKLIQSDPFDDSEVEVIT